jgi:hypothetical protein
MEYKVRKLPESMGLVTHSQYLTIIHAASLKQETLEDIISKVEEKYEKIKDFFAIEVIVPVSIFVFPNQLTLHLFEYNQEAANWIVGVGDEMGIRIINPDIAESVGRTYSSLIKTIIHELTHVLNHISLKGNGQTKIMGEGIASYMAEQHHIGMIKKNLTNIDNIAEVLFNTDDSEEFSQNSGYAYSYTVIEYILNRYGENKLQEYFLSQVEEPFETLKVDRNKFIQDWKQYLHQIYSD